MKNAAHFAHVSACNYPYYEPETEEHKKGKQLVKEWLESLFPNNLTFTEYYIKDARQRADVLTIFPDGHRLCIELQCSSLSLKVWQKRYSAYQEAKISQIWLIGSSLFKTTQSNSNQVKMSLFLKELCNTQDNQLFIIDVDKKQLIYLSNLNQYKRSKTIYVYKDKWEQLLLQSKISKFGTINTYSAEKVFQYRNRKLEEENQCLVERMKPWLLADIQSFHKKQYQKSMTRQPVFSELANTHQFNMQSVSPVIDQQIDGDQVFAIDHRLWQAYLFFTEIFHSYRRSSKYDSGIKKPQIYISNIIQKKVRRPDHPFRKMIVPYINYSLVRAKSINPRIFCSILYPHELIYQYLERLSEFGFLKNTTKKTLKNTSGGKYYGKFEVQFDRYYPEIFKTEDDIIQFFLSHKLIYRHRLWYDLKSWKIFQ